MSHEITWKSVHDERESLLEDLAGLSDAQWRAPSLCEDWSVQQVVAHLASSARTSKASAAKEMLTHKGNVQAVIDAGVARFSGGTPAETLEAFRESMHERVSPFSAEAALGEVVVHAEDIRRALDIEHTYPAETLRQLADHYKDAGLGMGAGDRIKGLHLMATDQKWETGQGDVVSGPIIALIMTMLGRTAYLDDLSGDNVETYRARLTR